MAIPIREQPNEKKNNVKTRFAGYRWRNAFLLPNSNHGAQPQGPPRPGMQGH